MAMFYDLLMGDATPLGEPKATDFSHRIKHVLVSYWN